MMQKFQLGDLVHNVASGSVGFCIEDNSEQVQVKVIGGAKHATWTKRHVEAASTALIQRYKSLYPALRLRYNGRAYNPNFRNF